MESNTKCPCCGCVIIMSIVKYCLAASRTCWILKQFRDEKFPHNNHRSYNISTKFISVFMASMLSIDRITNEFVLLREQCTIYKLALVKFQ